MKDKLAKAVIVRALKDLCSPNRRERESAETYFKSNTFSDDLLASAMNVGLRDSVSEIVVMSVPQKRYCVKQILREIG